VEQSTLPRRQKSSYFFNYETSEEARVDSRGETRGSFDAINALVKIRAISRGPWSRQLFRLNAKSRSFPVESGKRAVEHKGATAKSIQFLCTRVRVYV